MRLDNKTAVVTGGVSGIGKATALELARAGARVICADINAAKGADMVKEGRDAKLAIDYVPVDLSDRNSARACAAEILKRYERADIVVNAAGMSEFEMFVDNTPDYIDRIIAVNLAGPIHFTQALLPPMIAAGSGKIVNVASDAGRVGSSGESVYAGAKGGVIAFTKSLAREVARYAINVNCVCPGPTDTPMLQARSEKLKDAFIRSTAFRRLGKPQEMADAILFFASPRSDFVTGQVLSVSGGLTFSG
jgi:2-hydroxycyclohexanecarboxyl-CoA dehydrogenase